MQQLSEFDDTERAASAFRPNRKPFLVAVCANLALALLLLGVPYWRGRSQARQARHEFGELGRCLMGGESTSQPGLALPRGDRDHFAAKVMRDAASWPLSCRPVLARLAPEPAIFLWPSVKQAGADLRAAIELTERELNALSERRKAGITRVPERTLNALRRVQAATVLLARAGGAEDGLDNDALRWRREPALAVPARLPLMASDDATLDLYSSGTALEALALDGHGVSYLRVADGKVDRERLRRTSFVRALVRSGEDAYLVWAMPDSRCAEREDHCAGRPTGLAPYDKGAAALKDPVWKLAGHPSGRLDRALSLTASGRVLLLARAAADGGMALLRFQLPLPGPGLIPEAAQTTLSASERYELSAPATPQVLDASLVAGAEPPAALVVQADPADPTRLVATLQLADAAARRAPRALPGTSGEAPWTVGCAGSASLWLAYGSRSQLRLVRVATDSEASPPAELLTRELALPGALHAENPALDRMRIACRGERAQLSWISADRQLWATLCAAEGCSEPRSLASSVSSFAALLTDAGSIYALGSPADQVRILRLDPSGNPLAPSYAPSACFEPTSGMCGAPLLAADGQRIVLTARDRSELLALESTDGGASFTTLSGLRGADTIDQSTTRPLEQHRTRKGLDK